jgi:hypothetical protein
MVGPVGDYEVRHNGGQLHHVDGGGLGVERVPNDLAEPDPLLHQWSQGERDSQQVGPRERHRGHP